MRTALKAVGLAAILATGLTSSAGATGFRSYKICGGTNFATCAAVQISVVGKDVTVRVWNLSGNSAATYGTNTYAGTIFAGIGFYNVPAGGVASGLSVSGPAYGSTTPGNWLLTNNTKLTGFAMNFRTATPGGAANNGIASDCGSGLLPGSTNLYANPCNANLGNVGDYVTFTFKISGTWDPQTSDIAIRALNGPNGARTECWTGPIPSGSAANCTTVTPEPVTMSLLATGLAGMGGAGLMRRRKQKQQSV